MSGEYWIVAVPQGSKSKNVVDTQKKMLDRYCESVDEFKMPSLRVSALDELMKLNDKVAKYDVFARSVIYRLIRSYREYMEQPDIIPTVKDRKLHRFIPKFEWDKGRCPVGQKLPQLAEDIYEKFVTSNDRLKTMVEKYKNVKSSLSSDKRKTEGNLMVCDLQPFVKPTDYINGEYITTALVVVPTAKQKDFLEHYWCLEKTEEAKMVWKNLQKQKAQEDEVEEKSMSPEEQKKLEVVAPGTAELLKEDKDFCVFRVVVLKNGYEWFKVICREFRYTVRDFQYRDVSEQKKRSN